MFVAHTIYFQVKLPPLPKKFSQALRTYNEQVEQTFSYYLETVSEFVDRENGGHGTVLPLSGIGMFTQIFSNHKAHFL